MPSDDTLPSPLLIIAAGVSNSAALRQGIWQDNPDLTEEHGAAWAAMINQLNDLFKAPLRVNGQIIRLYPAVNVAAAYDAE